MVCKIRFLLLALAILEVDTLVPKSCSDIMPLDYDNMKPPRNKTLATIQQGVFNIGRIKIRDQTIVLKVKSNLEWKDSRLSNSSKLMG